MVPLQPTLPLLAVTLILVDKWESKKPYFSLAELCILSRGCLTAPSWDRTSQSESPQADPRRMEVGVLGLGAISLSLSVEAVG